MRRGRCGSILPGMCYRYEQISARKEIQFNQVEGLAIGRNIRLTDLKGTMSAFLQRMFGADRGCVSVPRISHSPSRAWKSMSSVSCATDRAVRSANIRAGWKSRAAAWYTRTVMRNGGYDPSDVQRLRVRAWGQSGSRCSSMASRIFATSGGTICASWSSFKPYADRSSNGEGTEHDRYSAFIRYGSPCRCPSLSKIAARRKHSVTTHARNIRYAWIIIS